MRRRDFLALLCKAGVAAAVAAVAPDPQLLAPQRPSEHPVGSLYFNMAGYEWWVLRAGGWERAG